MIINNWSLELNQPSGSSLAFCPAEMTTSNGKGANEDQYSCFEIAISEHMPGNKEIREERPKKNTMNLQETNSCSIHK